MNKRLHPKAQPSKLKYKSLRIFLLIVITSIMPCGGCSQSAHQTYYRDMHSVDQLWSTSGQLGYEKRMNATSK